MNILKIKLLVVSGIFTFFTISSMAQITDTGSNIGIAQTNPRVMLHFGVKGGLQSSTTTAGDTQLSHNFKIVNGFAKRIAAGYASRMVFGNGGQIYFQTAANGSWSSPIAWRQAMYIDNDGKVSIGESGKNIIIEDDLSTEEIEGDYKLFVEKGILTEKIKCAIANGTDWADYVFEEDYEMMDINELEDYVTENKHLPKVPSAEEMVANGLDVAKMDAKLLEKIEEAYLYIIDMNKEMNTINEKVDALATENASLKTSLQSISTSK